MSLRNVHASIAYHRLNVRCPSRTRIHQRFFLKVYSMRCLSLPLVMLILVTFACSAQVVDGQNGEAKAGSPQTGSAMAGQRALLDSRIVVGILKPIAGRNRPDPHGENDPFFHGGDSFPSGHAITSGSLASVIAHEDGHG